MASTPRRSALAAEILQFLQRRKSRLHDVQNNRAAQRFCSKISLTPAASARTHTAAGNNAGAGAGELEQLPGQMGLYSAVVVPSSGIATIAAARSDAAADRIRHFRAFPTPTPARPSDRPRRRPRKANRRPPFYGLGRAQYGQRARPVPHALFALSLRVASLACLPRAISYLPANS